MEFFATTGDAAKRATACAIVGVYDRKILGAAASEIDAATGGMIGKLLDRGDLSSKVGTARLINHVTNAKCKRIVVAGLGKKSEFGPREYAKAMRAALAEMKSTEITEAVNYLSREPVSGAAPYYLGRFAAQAAGDYLYRFNKMKSKGGKRPAKLRKLGFGSVDKDTSDELLRGASHGAGIVTGMNLTKDLGNLPPNVCTPRYLAEQAQAMGERCRDLTVDVLDEPDMLELGMNSLLSVGNGSEQSSYLIVMHYRGGAQDEDPVILVGKGITFDTGGISLKPGPNMDEMKYDMGGAAAVIGAMAATVALRLPINLTVLVPTAENMPSGRASRPGDIVKSMSGQTIEILNTDAEGRLILCDALTYAQQFSPKAMIDVATLTGACVIALGHHRTGIMSRDDAFAEELKASGERANDRAWQLPLDAEYAEQLKSNFADMANVGGREGGAITAGAFLGKFTEGQRWAHLDIAGTAWLSGKNKGATGRPVPLLMEYLLGQADRL